MTAPGQKNLELNEAISIAKKAGKGGAEIVSIYDNLIIDKTYRKIVEIKNEIENTR